MNLWMRWVNFRALRDILLLVRANPHKLRAADLVRLTSEEKIMTGRNGKPLGASSHYHHRRTLERLGLLTKQGGRYALNNRSPEAMTLTSRSSLGSTLVSEEKEAFANVILRNEDCRNAFFDQFMQAGTETKDVLEFIERAQPIEMSVFQGHAGSNRPRLRATHETPASLPGQKHVAMRAFATKEWSVFSGTNAIQAIHFGLRAWSVDQLSFLDNIYRTGGLYCIYPKQIALPLTNDELASRMVDSLNFVNEWTTIRVGDFALRTGIEHRVSIEQTKDVLMSWMRVHPDVVAGIPTNERFIAGGLADGQRGLVLKGFLLEPGGAYVSHLRIHRSLHHRVRRKLKQP